MAPKNHSALKTAEFDSDYLNYLSANEQLDQLLVVETLSQRNQRMAKPSGPCACDGCQRAEPPTQDFTF